MIATHRRRRTIRLISFAEESKEEYKQESGEASSACCDFPRLQLVAADSGEALL